MIVSSLYGLYINLVFVRCSSFLLSPLLISPLMIIVNLSAAENFRIV